LTGDPHHLAEFALDDGRGLHVHVGPGWVEVCVLDAEGEIVDRLSLAPAEARELAGALRNASDEAGGAG
jgi:hypothetical protein